MSLAISPAQDQLQQWSHQGLSPKGLEELLVSNGLDPEIIVAYVGAYKKHRNAKKQFAGFFYMTVGAFLGFLSCVLTLLDVAPEYATLILFGLTTVGIVLIVVGMYILFEG
jgi:hypothetical protein